MVRTRLTCQAPHPASGKGGRHENRAHGKSSGVTVPFACRWTGRVYKPGTEPQRSTFVLFECPDSDCKHVSEYEVMAPPKRIPVPDLLERLRERREQRKAA